VTPVEREKELQSIRDLEIAQVAAFGRGDLAGAISCFADDAQIIFPGRRIVTGQDNIRAWAAEMIADRNLVLGGTPGPMDVSANGEMAYTTMNYDVKFTDPQTQRVVSDQGIMIAIWKKVHGAWKMVRDLNIPGVPASNFCEPGESS
jgi:ketosteroid isomerase-like protein